MFNVVYKPEHAEKAEGLALLGLTNEQIAWAFDITSTTIYDWIQRYPEFKQALWNGREGADEKVARSLFQRAVGYSHPSEEIKVLSSGNNGGSFVERVPIVKQYPPETTAAIFWLKNRRRDTWKNDPAANDDSDPQDAAAAARAAIRASEATEKGEE